MKRGAIYLLALAWLAVSGVPFFFMAQTGFKQRYELLSGSIWALPAHPTLDNFRTVLSGRFLALFVHSVLVVSLSVVIVLMVSAMAAYVLARLQFRLRRALLALIVAGLVVPTHVTLIPVYLLMTATGLYDTLWALIGPYVAFSIPSTVFILTDFMRQIPRELEESARIDGCGPMGTFFRVFLPLSRPALATLAIFNAVGFWNEFVFAFVLTASPSSRTLPVGVWDFQGQYAINVPVIMAMLTLSAFPILAVYVAAQKRVQSGMLAGAVKG
jgi:raffinose/stachyose/melibiose transport system permease protein